MLKVEDDRLARKVCESEIYGPRCSGRPQKGSMDDVKEMLSKRGLNIQEAKE